MTHTHDDKFASFLKPKPKVPPKRRFPLNSKQERVLQYIEDRFHTVGEFIGLLIKLIWTILINIPLICRAALTLSVWFLIVWMIVLVIYLATLI